jgi:hypothetical protein
VPASRIPFPRQVASVKVSWTSIDPEGKYSRYGAAAVDKSGIYVRSQQQLVKLNHPQKDG